MNAPIFVLITLIAAAVIATAIFLGALLLVPARPALRIAGAAAIGGAISFAGTGLGMAPFHPDALVSGPAAYAYFGTALLAGLVGGLLCAAMLYQLSRRKT